MRKTLADLTEKSSPAHGRKVLHNAGFESTTASFLDTSRFWSWRYSESGEDSFESYCISG